MHKIISYYLNYKHFNTVITGKLFLFIKNYVKFNTFKISFRERFREIYLWDRWWL